MSDDPRYCPSCKADLQGVPIPQEDIDKGYYAPGSTHFSRLIGVEDPRIYDGIIRWCCPDCAHEWPRKGMERFWVEPTPKVVSKVINKNLFDLL